MKLLKHICALALLCCGCYAQSTQAPATSGELQFFRFMLMSLASIDHDQKAIAAHESLLVQQFGLNTQESAAIHAAAATLHTLLVQLRPQAQAILAGKTVLLDADAAALDALIGQREQLIATLANQILNSVRAETANRLRTPGHVLAATVGTPGSSGPPVAH